MPDEIEMPTPCAECGGIWDLNSLYRHPHVDDLLVCPACKRQIDEDDSDA